MKLHESSSNTCLEGEASFNFSQFPGGFAVLMAVYHRDDPRILGMAIDSVFMNSLLPNQFVLVVDGALSDELETVLTKLQTRHLGKFEILRLSTNRGLAQALNAGLKHITFPWVVRADADDLNLSHRFASLAALLKEQPSLKLMSSAILEVNADGVAIAARMLPISDTAIRYFAKKRSPFNHMAVAYHRETVLACGGYPDVYLKEDYALWCRMLSSGILVANSPDVLVHATAGRDMYQRRGGWRYAKAEWALQVIMVKCGLKNWPSACLDGLTRALVFLAPAGLRGFIYENILRTKINE